MNEEEKLLRIRDWLGTGTINIFGLPYSGKDTQANQLASFLDTKVLGGGDILRSQDMPEHVRAAMRTGALIPTEDYINIVLPHLANPELTKKPLVLSSVGRWHGEEPSVIAALEKSKHPLKAVVYLDIGEDTVWERWQNAQDLQDRGNREDEDQKEKIQVRLDEFSNKTRAVIDFYNKSDLLIKIDGNQSREEVTKNIVDSLVAYIDS